MRLPCGLIEAEAIRKAKPALCGHSAGPAHFCGHCAFEHPAWLKMPEGMGHLAGFWDGKKINSPTELPREFLDRMEREYPELLEPRWGEFDRPIPFDL